MSRSSSPEPEDLDSEPVRHEGAEILLLPPPHVMNTPTADNTPSLPEIAPQKGAPRQGFVVDLPSAERLQAIARASKNQWENRRTQTMMKQYLMERRRAASGMVAVPESPCASRFSSFNSALGSPARS